MKIIIAGGRTFNNYILLKLKCNFIFKNITEEIIIFSGCAEGADKLGENYAKEKGYKLQKYPADWNTYGKSAGYERNKEMANSADCLIAFWDGKSKGTKMMIELAQERGLKVRIIKYA